MKQNLEDNQMVQQEASGALPIILIYYNFRGIGQMIRYLLCYLQIPFIDVLLDEYQKQREKLPKEILQILRAKAINKNDLPGIIHNNQVIYELNQIINYLCITFNREDLLGVDIYQKARVCEIQEIYLVKLANNIRFLSGFVAEIHQNPLVGESLLAFIESKLVSFFEVSGYFRQLSEYLLRQTDQKFVLGNLTVIDFYFIETSRFAVGLFSNIDEELAQHSWTDVARNYRLKKQSNGSKVHYVENLKAMKKYIQFFTNQPLYLSNQQYLESFKQFPKSITGEQKEGMKKLETTYFLDLYYKG